MGKGALERQPMVEPWFCVILDKFLTSLSFNLFILASACGAHFSFQRTDFMVNATRTGAQILCVNAASLGGS